MQSTTGALKPCAYSFNTASMLMTRMEMASQPYIGRCTLGTSRWCGSFSNGALTCMRRTASTGLKISNNYCWSTVQGQRRAYQPSCLHRDLLVHGTENGRLILFYR